MSQKKQKTFPLIFKYHDYSEKSQDCIDRTGIAISSH